MDDQHTPAGEKGAYVAKIKIEFAGLQPGLNARM